MKINKKGGFTFEEMYVPLIQFCIDYNNRDAIELFGESSILHIKGGASIKYHLTKAGINTNGITSDIDILLIPNEEDYQSALNNFYEAIQRKFSDYNFSITNNNGLYNICINNFCIFDITIYNQYMNQSEDHETSMFLYALKKMGFDSITDYVNKLLQQTNIEIKTFTSIQFEYFSTLKGLENTSKYLGSIDKWRNNKIRYESINPKTNNITRIIARLNYQTSPVYIAKLQDKYNRYLYKRQMLESILYPQ
jgi:hypothetical protein